jgi:segregation and condensation protein B
MNDVAIKLEALLFAVGRPMSKKELAAKLSVSLEDLNVATKSVAKKEGSGVVVVDDGSNLELRAAPEAAQMIEEIRREELSREVGRAGLEALAAILYRGPLTRSEIDFIRGVNSSQTLRTLLMRGLIRKVSNPKDERSFLYEPTTDLLAQLGVTTLTDLPQYNEIKQKLSQLEASYKEKEASSNQS